MKSAWRIGIAVAVVLSLITFEVMRLRSQPEHRAEPAPPQESPSASGCIPDQPPARTGTAPTLVDVTASVGIDFQHQVGPLGTYFMPESIGAGGAMFDYDLDGRLDLYLVNCGRSPEGVGPFPSGREVANRLYRQRDDGTFEDVTEQTGLGDLGYGAGCAVADVDNDGDLDVYVTNYGLDRLYLNQQGERFLDVTMESGLINEGWGTCAAFFDYDRDGWLDLVVVNYTDDPDHDHSVACGFQKGLVSYCGPHKFRPTIDRLYHNEGLQPNAQGEMVVRFVDVTETAGLSSTDTYGFGVVCSDVDGDLYPDILIANDGAPNRLWMNQRDGTFREEAELRGVALNAFGQPEAGMGIAIGDVNRDGMFDFVMSHLSVESSTLYLNGSEGTFRDATDGARLTEPTMRRTGWGIALVDLDHDGFLDLPQVNGLVVPCHSGFPFHGEDTFQVRRDVITDPDAFWRDYADLNVLLMQTAAGVFELREDSGDFGRAIASGRGLICGDYDDDGDIDLLVTNCGGPARLYRNEFIKRGHWLGMKVIDPQKQRDALGAIVRLELENGTQYGQLNPASSYLASHDPRLHFGLGESAEYERIVVGWPDGPVERAWEEFPGGAADRFITLNRGSGRPLSETP